MRRTGVVKDRLYLEHHTAPGHPENHHRLEALYSMRQDEDINGRYVEIKPRFCEEEDLKMIHSAEYVEKVAQTAGLSHSYLDPDTQTSPKSYDAARLAVGGLFEAIDMIQSEKLDNAFAMIRPPGHHAEYDRAMGFCLFNNVALGARYAQKRWGLRRIMIIDWDLHHGNGTQNAFYDDPNVLYCSTHQYPYYPGTGHFNEVGRGRGEGYTVNMPLSTGQGDEEYSRVFKRIFYPICLGFGPDLIIISAGFDIHYNDPLGGMRVTEKGFARLARSVLDMARKNCSGRLVVALEGGYNLEGLRKGVKAVLAEMIEDSNIEEEPTSNPRVDPLIDRVLETQKRYWGDCFHEDY